MRSFACLTLLLILPYSTLAEDVRELAAKLRDFDSRVIVLGTVRQPPLANMLARDIDARLRLANRADTRLWEQIKTKKDWTDFRSGTLAALEASLGDFPPRGKPDVRVTATHEGEGYRVDNLVYPSRNGLLVTANLYRPSKPANSMPAILICHSHQSSKHTGWRQDMAMTWARAGCVVLVPDHLGHGERRQHPFGGDDPKIPPHDYHFRYELGIQLHLVGESLMGWMVHDLMRGVDVLLAEKGVDPKRLILISEPAGGGDVAAVAAALDDRIACVMVQNFGGPQPETAYPLPRDADDSFDFTGSGSWESTRNLRRSACDGFLPWTIVASVLPRRLIYFHEFYWDKDQDPVWKRLERVRQFTGGDGPVGIAGHGFVVGSAPENSHWLPVNRQRLYPTLEKWFDIPNPKTEFSKRRPESELICLTPEIAKEMPAFHDVVARLGAKRSADVRGKRAKLAAAERRGALRFDWNRLLGAVAAERAPALLGEPIEPTRLGNISAQKFHLRTEPGIVVPVVLFVPDAKAPPPVVLAVAQEGKQAFLKERSGAIAELLASGVAVCLPDVRGTGETSPEGGRDRRSPATRINASEWMLGESLLAGRLRDLRAVIRLLETRRDVDGRRLALWGDSFAKVNDAKTDLVKPHTVERPPSSEPLGGLLALLGGLFEDDVRVVAVHRGLSDYQSVAGSRFCYVPHDAIVPGVLSVAGDLDDVAASLAPRPLWLGGLVDEGNRVLKAEEVARRYGLTRAAYASSKQFQMMGDDAEPMRMASWIVENLRR